jgi:hypothetical protein
MHHRCPLVSSPAGEWLTSLRCVRPNERHQEGEWWEMSLLPEACYNTNVWHTFFLPLNQ